MRGAMKFGVVVWAMASAIVIGFSTRVGTTGGVTDAPTGFDGLSNGFAEEYCANQQALRNSPYSPEIPGANGLGRTKDECLQSLADAIALILEDRREDGLRGVPADALREVVTVQ